MRYIGNKTKMLKNINNFICKNKITGKVFCDIFAGSGSVGNYFKNKYEIISNDILYSSFLFNFAKLNFNSEPEFLNFKKKNGIDPFIYFNNKKYFYEESFFVTNNYSPLGNRQYLSKENSIKIDGIRLEIEELYKTNIIDFKEYCFLLASLLESTMSFSNITGTYEAFLKKWDSRSTKKFKLTKINFVSEENLKRNMVYNEDANELVRKINGDILYIDPPYTITNYLSAYHFLETLAKYDYPDIKGITGRRNNDSIILSKYNRKIAFLANLEDLLRQASFEHIILSYSTQGLASVTEIENLLKKFSHDGTVKIEYFSYREYKNIKSSQKPNELKEVIFYIKKNIKILKSPLNYSGSKYSIVEQIFKYLPKKMDYFIDIMGGAFNVGLNVFASKKVIYNEYLLYVYAIINYLLNENKEKIIFDIKDNIQRWKLSKGGKDNFLKFRKFYNNNKSPLYLFILQMFCFQNQIRLNSNLDFNTPVGNSGFNETTIERILDFVPKTQNYSLFAGNYKKINLDLYEPTNTVIYFDPPYFITNATYNDGIRGYSKWKIEDETELLDYITKIHNLGFKFILSNVLFHKDKKNNILIKWIETHGFKIINLKYNKRKEVIILNFDWRLD